MFIDNIIHFYYIHVRTIYFLVYFGLYGICRGWSTLVYFGLLFQKFFPCRQNL